MNCQSAAIRLILAPNIEEEHIDDGLSPDEIMARMNNSNVNEFGRDPEKGEISFLGSFSKPAQHVAQL